MSEFGEPWRYDSDAGQICAGDEPIIDSERGWREYRGERDFQRIVLCVNACAGLSDETLRAVVEGKASLVTLTIFPASVATIQVGDGTYNVRHEVPAGSPPDSPMDSHQPAFRIHRP